MSSITLHAQNTENWEKDLQDDLALIASLKLHFFYQSIQSPPEVKEFLRGFGESPQETQIILVEDYRRNYVSFSPCQANGCEGIIGAGCFWGGFIGVASYFFPWNVSCCSCCFIVCMASSAGTFLAYLGSSCIPILKCCAHGCNTACEDCADDCQDCGSEYRRTRYQRILDNNQEIDDANFALLKQHLNLFETDKRCLLAIFSELPTPVKKIISEYMLAAPKKACEKSSRRD